MSERVREKEREREKLIERNRRENDRTFMSCVHQNMQCSFLTQAATVNFTALKLRILTHGPHRRLHVAR